MANNKPITILAEPENSTLLNSGTENQKQFDAPTLLERGMTTYNELNRQITNFHFTDAGGGSYTQDFSLRGLSNTDIFSDPAVIVYVSVSSP